MQHGYGGGKEGVFLGLKWPKTSEVDDSESEPDEEMSLPVFGDLRGM